MVNINPTISTITLNVNGLNAAIKRQRSQSRFKKHGSIRNPWLTIRNPH